MRICHQFDNSLQLNRLYREKYELEAKIFECKKKLNEVMTAIKREERK